MITTIIKHNKTKSSTTTKQKTSLLGSKKYKKENESIACKETHFKP